MMLTKSLKYVFYRGYLWQVTAKNENSRMLNALGYVTAILVLFGLSVVALLNDLLEFPSFLRGQLGAASFAIAGAALFFIAPYLYLKTGDRYKKILSEMSAIPETEFQLRVRSVLIFMSYIVLFLVMIVLAVLHNK